MKTFPERLLVRHMLIRISDTAHVKALLINHGLYLVTFDEFVHLIEFCPRSDDGTMDRAHVRQRVKQ